MAISTGLSSYSSISIQPQNKEHLTSSCQSLVQSQDPVLVKVRLTAIDPHSIQTVPVIGTLVESFLKPKGVQRLVRP
jgi:hypothetical protein